MRTRFVVMILSLAIVAALLVPGEASARRLLLLGSLTVQKAGGATPTAEEVTGLAVILNPGLEKTMSQQLPPFTIPVFVDEDNGGPNFDTLLALTNVTSSAIDLQLILHDRAGVQIGVPTPVHLNGHATESLFVSTLVP